MFLKMGKLNNQKNQDSAHSWQRIETAWLKLFQRPMLGPGSNKPFKDLNDGENHRTKCSLSCVLATASTDQSHMYL